MESEEAAEVQAKEAAIAPAASVSAAYQLMKADAPFHRLRTDLSKMSHLLRDSQHSTEPTDMSMGKLKIRELSARIDGTTASSQQLSARIDTTTANITAQNSKLVSQLTRLEAEHSSL